MRRGMWMICCAVAALTARPAAAQGGQSVTVPARNGAPGLGMAYGWERPFFVDADGTLHRDEHPTVRQVNPGSAAARAGLRVGDVILTVNGRDARQGRLFNERRPGTRYAVRIRRGNEDREVEIVLPASEN